MGWMRFDFCTSRQWLSDIVFRIVPIASTLMCVSFGVSFFLYRDQIRTFVDWFWNGRIVIELSVSSTFECFTSIFNGDHNFCRFFYCFGFFKYRIANGKVVASIGMQWHLLQPIRKSMVCFVISVYLLVWCLIDSGTLMMQYCLFHLIAVYKLAKLLTYCDVEAILHLIFFFDFSIRIRICRFNFNFILNVPCIWHFVCLSFFSILYDGFE